MVLDVSPFELEENRIAILKSAYEKGLTLICTRTPYGDVWQVRFPDGSLSPLFKHFEDAWDLLTRVYWREYARKEAEER